MQLYKLITYMMDGEPTGNGIGDLYILKEGSWQSFRRAVKEDDLFFEDAALAGVEDRGPDGEVSIIVKYFVV